MSGKYFLLSKTVNQPFVKYKNAATRYLGDTPYTFDEVIVGIYGSKKTRKITTFRNSNGEIIERVLDYPGKHLKSRIYSKQYNIIGENEFVTSTIIKEFSLKRYLESSYKNFKEQMNSLFSLANLQDSFWKRCKTFTNHLSENVNTGAKILSKVEIKPAKYHRNEHNFVEYPEIINGMKLKTNKKYLSFKVSNNGTKVIPRTHKESAGIKYPKDDEFLAIRGLDINDAKEPITRYSIHKRNLDNADIEINTNYLPKIDGSEDALIAFYNDINGTINYNRFYSFCSKSKLANTAAHETEHSRQWMLHARNTGGETLYTITLAKKLGPLTDINEIIEAQKCTKSIDNYVQFDEDYKKYYDSYIERMARERGKQAEESYNRQKQVIRSNFKHIPEELL